MVRSMAGCKFTWWTSVGISVLMIFATLPSGIGTFWLGPVTGMFRISCLVSNLVSGYCTPTKYCMPFLGSNQKLFLL